MSNSPPRAAVEPTATTVSEPSGDAIEGEVSLDETPETTSGEPAADEPVVEEAREQADVPVLPAADADLAVSATGPALAAPGGTFLIAVVAQNVVGGDTTGQVTLSLSNTTYSDSSIPCADGGATVTCDVTLAAGATQLFTVELLVDGGLTNGATVVTDIAIANTDGDDSNPGNDEVQVVVTVDDDPDIDADLSVTKTADPSW